MKLLKTIYSFIEQLARARAAGVMARSGDIKGAMALMNEKAV